jgi:hypothetical protein
MNRGSCRQCTLTDPSAPTTPMTSSIHGNQPPSSGTEMARCPNVPPNDAPPISVWSELQSNEVACCCSYVALYPELWWLLPQDLCPHLWQATSRKPPRLVVVLPCPYRLIQPRFVLPKEVFFCTCEFFLRVLCMNKCVYDACVDCYVSSTNATTNFWAIAAAQLAGWMAEGG